MPVAAGKLRSSGVALESSSTPVLFLGSLVHFPERQLALSTEFLVKLHKTWAWPGVN